MAANSLCCNTLQLHAAAVDTDVCRNAHCCSCSCVDTARVVYFYCWSCAITHETT
eukprot:gene10196-2354_t